MAMLNEIRSLKTRVMETCMYGKASGERHHVIKIIRNTGSMLRTNVDRNNTIYTA